MTGSIGRCLLVLVLPSNSGTQFSLSMLGPYASHTPCVGSTHGVSPCTGGNTLQHSLAVAGGESWY